MNRTILTNALGVVLALLCGLSFSHARTLTVTSTVDGMPGSLRATIQQARTGDDIVFDSDTDGSLISLTLGAILIDRSVTITGNGVGATMISGNDQSRIFTVQAGRSLSLKDLQLQNGQAMLGGAILNEKGQVTLEGVNIMACTATGDMATQGGGAIANVGGLVTIQGGTFMNNTAPGASGSGGAILNLDRGTLNLVDTELLSNSSSRAGGAIEDNSGGVSEVRLRNVTMIDNETGPSPGNGGAIHMTGDGYINVMGGAVENNRAAAEGGGLWNGSGRMIVLGVLFDGNVASGDDAS